MAEVKLDLRDDVRDFVVATGEQTGAGFRYERVAGSAPAAG